MLVCRTYTQHTRHRAAAAKYLTFSLYYEYLALLYCCGYIHTYMVYYARRQQNIQQSRQKHTIKHKEEHNIQRTKKYTKLNYKNTIH